jgi:uncharacterized membrane protein YgdD (TMEM256/DUF423 family)
VLLAIGGIVLSLAHVTVGTIEYSWLAALAAVLLKSNSYQAAYRMYSTTVCLCNGVAAALLCLLLLMQVDEVAAMATAAVALLAAGSLVYAGVRVLRRVTTTNTATGPAVQEADSSLVQVRTV